MTYCSQSVTGRIHGKEPYCRSLCVRKVFPHEVRNVIAFKQHKQVDQSGKAAYPLPTEGQPANLPRILGGKPPEDHSNHNPKNWDEGLYLWTGKGPTAAHQKIDSMSLDFEHQRQVVEMRERRRCGRIIKIVFDKKMLLARRMSERGCLMFRLDRFQIQGAFRLCF